MRFPPLIAVFLAALGVCSSEAEVIINELMYHPAGTNVLEEYIELFNASPYATNVSGWKFTHGVNFTFPAGAAIPATGFLVVAADAATFAAKHPGITNFVADWNGVLSDDGDHLTLENASGDVVDQLRYAPEGDWAERRLGPADQYGKQGWEWHAEHAGEGKSLELINPGLPRNSGLNWGSSIELGGTPGRANSIFSTNSAPLLLGVSQFPLVPKSSDSVRVTTRLADESSTGASATLFYRVDGTPEFLSAPMFDDGAHGDGLAGDNLFGAVIPAQPDGTIIEFYLMAKDAEGYERTYPKVVPSGNERTANLIYQVSNELVGGIQPTYRLVMTTAEYNYLKSVWSGAPSSDAGVNGTFIASDGIEQGGTTTQLRYNASFRNRGHGTRVSVPHNFRVDLPKDKPWNGRFGINLNTQYTESQVLGSALMRRAGLPMAESRAARVRVNGLNLANSGSPQFGYYAANEVVNGALLDRQIPDDPDGNLYRGIRDFVPGAKADLSWQGTLWNSYTNAYFKQNNQAQNDFSDLIHLVNVLNNTGEGEYANAVRSVANVEEWLRYFALNTLMGNQETALGTGYGDDYALYRGANDVRFILLPYDMDSVLGQGRRTTSYEDGIFRMFGSGNNSNPTLQRFIKEPEFAPIYYKQLVELADTIFAPSQMNPLLDQLEDPFGSGPEIEGAITNMKLFNASQVAYVRSQIPLALTASSSLPLNSGYAYTTINSVALQGRANAVTTREVLVNGQRANWSAWQASWSANAQLHPGINRILVQSLDAAGIATAQTNVAVWYDDGSTQTAGGIISSDTTWLAANGPYQITSSLTIESGATLNIEAGTTVYLANGANLTVANGGRLMAEGTSNSPITFVSLPGTAARWGGIVINGGVGSPETRISNAYFEGNGTTCIHSSGGTVWLDHLDFGSVDKQYVSLDNSSFVVSHCRFPTPSASFEPFHGTGGIKSGGHGIVTHNYFGQTSGYSDVIDFTGGNHPGPIIHFIGNVFSGASDDMLDLDGTDAWVEGNIFLHAHKNGSPDSSSAVSGGNDSGNTSEVTIIGNLFYDCDQATTAKQGNFYTMIQNTIVHQTHKGGLDTDGAVLNLADEGTTEGLGFYLEGNIIYDVEKMVRNFTSAKVTLTNNLTSLEWDGEGGGNSSADPLFNRLPKMEETYFDSWESAQVMWDWLGLQNGSPGLGTGSNGQDKGGVIPLGVSINGVPGGTNNLRDLTITLGVARSGNGIPANVWPLGSGFVTYKWRLDSGSWSGETSIGTPFQLNGLADGPHRIEAVGKFDSGIWQDDPLLGTEAVVSTKEWVVDGNSIPPVLPALRINEVLAKNVATFTSGETTPDLIELYNQSSQTVQLDGMSLSDDLAAPNKFVFTGGLSIPARGYLVLLCDSDFASPGIHTGFALSQDGDAVYLFDSPTRGAKLVDQVEFGIQAADYSIGRVADNSWHLCVPTFGSENIAQRTGDPRQLKINEWLASAEFFFGADFVELYNPESVPVALDGLYLTDAAGTPERHAFPALSFIAGNSAHAFVADGKDQSNHLNFKLSRDAGLLMLSDEDAVVIDVVNYGPQRTDVSQGRSPSGATLLEYFNQPTPGGLNPGVGSATEVVTHESTSLLNFTHSWKYLDSGVAAPANWMSTAYSDLAWKSGSALFGVETSSPYPYPFRITTPLPLLNGSTHIKTYYFRTHFTITNKNGIQLWSTNYLDDGAVFYINGVRAGALRVADNPATYTSDSSLQPTEGQAELLVLAGDNVVDGDNVLAVEVHQSGNNSSDVVFGMSLSAVRSITNIISPGSMPVVLNEFLAVNETIQNGTALPQPWIELYNPATNSASLAGLSLSDDPANPRKFVFPNGTEIAAHGFYVVACDTNLQPSATNTGFQIGRNGGAVYLFNRIDDGGGALDAISYGLQTADFAIGRVPDGEGEWQLTLPTANATNALASIGSAEALRLNEWMANSSTTDDWFEVVNTDSAPVSLSGICFTDDLNEPAKSPIRPLSFIGSGSHAYVQIWADGATASGANHASFKLSKSGSDLAIGTVAGNFIDSLHFGSQLANVSEGRLPDGFGGIVQFPLPTPGLPNAIGPSDSDGDGLPDAWETANSLNPNDATDAAQDADGDGLSNRDEYLAGTDPRNAGSSLALSGRVSNGSFELSFLGISGKQYSLQYKNDLRQTEWQTLSTFTAAQTGISIVPDQVQVTRFYRVIVSQ